MHGINQINRLNGMSNKDRQEYILDQDLKAQIQAEATEKADEVRRTFWTIIGVVLIIVTAALAGL
jgi:hypothetical protein